MGVTSFQAFDQMSPNGKLLVFGPGIFVAILIARHPSHSLPTPWRGSRNLLDCWSDQIVPLSFASIYNANKQSMFEYQALILPPCKDVNVREPVSQEDGYRVILQGSIFRKRLLSETEPSMPKWTQHPFTSCFMGSLISVNVKVYLWTYIYICCLILVNVYLYELRTKIWYMAKGHPKVGWAPIGFAVAAPCTNLPEGIVLGIVLGWAPIGFAAMATPRPSQYYFGHT